MAANDKPLFPTLEPPVGGAERFARRLDEPMRTRGPALAVATATVAMVLVALIYLSRPGPDGDDAQPVTNLYDAPEFDRLLGRELEATELTVVINDESAQAHVVASSNPRIRIYELR